jgi:hypothetical protein
MVLVGMVCGLIGNFINPSAQILSLVFGGAVAGFVLFTVFFSLFRQTLNTWAVQLETSGREDAGKRIEKFLDQRRVNYLRFVLKLAVKLLTIAWLLSDIRHIEPSFRFWCAIFLLIIWQGGLERRLGKLNRFASIAYSPVIYSVLYLLQTTNPFDGPNREGWAVFGWIAAFQFAGGLYRLLTDLRMIRHGFIVTGAHQPLEAAEPTQGTYDHTIW